MLSPKTIRIGGTTVRQDEHGRLNLNDLHQASGGDQKHRPKYFLQGSQVKGLVEVIKAKGGNPPFEPVAAKRGRFGGGTFVASKLVILYAAWVSPQFLYRVLDVFEEYEVNRATITIKTNEKAKLLAATKARGSVGGSLLRKHQIEQRAIEQQFANLDALVQLSLFPETHQQRLQ